MVNVKSTKPLIPSTIFFLFFFWYELMKINLAWRKQWVRINVQFNAKICVYYACCVLTFIVRRANMMIANDLVINAACRYVHITLVQTIHLLLSISNQEIDASKQNQQQQQNKQIFLFCRLSKYTPRFKRRLGIQARPPRVLFCHFIVWKDLYD